MLTHLNDARTASAYQRGMPAGQLRGYDGVSRITAHRWIECTLDANGFVTGYVNPGTPLIGFRHAWNAADNKLSQELMHATGDSEGYKYDSAYRLIKFERGTLNAALTEIVTLTTTPGLLQRQTFTLDGPGNWPTNVTTTGGTPTTENRTHNNLNQIAAIGASPLTYDSNGNLTDDGSIVFAWDAKNRLRRATRKSDNVVVGLYAYDALGRRIRRVYVVGADPAKTVHYYLDGQRVIEEREIEGTPPAEVFKRQYTYGPYIDEALTLDRDLNANGSATDSGERLFYHANSLYSVFGLSDSNRNFPERYLYDAYGRAVLWLPGPDSTYGTADDPRTVNGSSTVQNVRLFTGREWDVESLLYYFRVRYQTPQLGRFLSRDRLYSVNVYDYTRDQATRLVDPSGLLPWWIYPPAGAAAYTAGCCITLKRERNQYGARLPDQRERYCLDTVARIYERFGGANVPAAECARKKIYVGTALPPGTKPVTPVRYDIASACPCQIFFPPRTIKCDTCADILQLYVEVFHECVHCKQIAFSGERANEREAYCKELHIYDGMLQACDAGLFPRCWTREECRAEIEKRRQESIDSCREYGGRPVVHIDTRIDPSDEPTPVIFTR